MIKKFFKITDNNFINGLIFFVLGGIGYGTITAKLGEWWNYFVISVQAVYNFILFLLNYEVRVWVFIVFIAVIVGGLMLFAFWLEKRNTNGVQQTRDSSIAVGELEKQILRVFEQYYGQSFDIKSIAQKLNNNDMLSLEQALINLAHTFNFLQRHDDYYGTTFTLNGYGRNYILQNMR